MKFNVFTGVYPFDKKLGEVSGDTEEIAFGRAKMQFSTNDDPNPVIEPASFDDAEKRRKVLDRIPMLVPAQLH